jgi:hypothetical protein
MKGLMYLLEIKFFILKIIYITINHNNSRRLATNDIIIIIINNQLLSTDTL